MDHRHYLCGLFEPASVALVLGADPPVWTGELARRLRKGSLPSRVLSLARADAELRRRPGRAELVLIATPSAEVPAAIGLATRLRARAVCVMSEAGGPDDARNWGELARAQGLRLLGPASMGFVRPASGLNASRFGPMPATGHVALVSQSGVLNAAVLDWVADYSVGFSLAVSLGAEADTELAQVLDYLASDVQTRSVIVYLEAVRDSRSFISALRALALVKPVVVLKGHRDDAPARRGQTHSGAICGSDAIYRAALRRAGALQLRLFTQMFTAARLLAASTAAVGNRLAVLGNGNGPCVLAADQAWFQRLRLPMPSPATQDALRGALPGRVLANPLNLGVNATAADYVAALRAMAADPAIDGVLVLLVSYAGVDVRAITEAVVAAAAGIRKPLVACWMGDRRVRPLAMTLDAAGVPVYSVPEAAVDAYATLAKFHQNQRLLQQMPRPLAGPGAPRVDDARRLVRQAIDEGHCVLDARRCQALLEAFHVPLTRSLHARTASEAILHAETLGYPVVMKIAAEGVTHKSDVGGVVLNLRSGAEVRAQFAELLAGAGQAGAGVDGVLLQSMRRSRRSVELYVGVFRDPLFGPVIAFGAGGTRVEMVGDTTLEFPPMNRYLARRMIERTRVAPVLQRLADETGADLDAVETLLVSVSEMVCELPWIAEMDINPVIVDERGVIAVDARVVLDPSVGPAPTRHAHMAIMPYPSHRTRRLQTPQGESYTLRAIQPEDAERLQAFVKSLSAQSRYFRFISVLSELPPRMLIRYTQIDYDRELALVAVVPDASQPLPDGEPGERIVGVVRYLLNNDRESCEFAIAIADDWQGRRLGSTMMRAIIDAARDKGLRRIEGYVLAVNSRMLALMTHLGFTVTTDPEDATMKIVWMALHEA